VARSFVIYSSVELPGGGFCIVPLDRRQRGQQQESQPLIDSIGQDTVDEHRRFIEVRQEFALGILVSITANNPEAQRDFERALEIDPRSMMRGWASRWCWSPKRAFPIAPVKTINGRQTSYCWKQSSAIRTGRWHMRQWVGYARSRIGRPKRWWNTGLR
jgi:hypothetical protein